MFERGDFVWGKMKSYPWWPAMVINPEDCRREKQSTNKLWLFWFGDHKHSQVDVEKITDFEKGFARYSKKSSSKHFKKALEEVLEILASLNRPCLPDSVSLQGWANSGFKSNSPMSFKWKKTDLPKIIQAVLVPYDISSDESEIDVVTNENNDDLIEKVIAGKKSLEDICISCCKKNRKLINFHPYFIGKVCTYCKKNVKAACKTSPGQPQQDLCIICGLGGNLVFCSNSKCTGSFCQICIEYLASEKIYLEIIENDEWPCYLCAPVENKNILIKRRTVYKPKDWTYFFDNSKSKSSISALASNGTGLKVLKKAGIKVKNYSINPTIIMPPDVDLKYFNLYYDFSFSEVKEISADLILGSSFHPHESIDRRKRIKSFYKNFFRFLCRLDFTRINKLNVLFIFLAEVNVIDEVVKTRVTKFLAVNPLSIKARTKNIMVWSNFSECVLTELEELEIPPFSDDSTVEEIILYFYIKHLKEYFETEHAIKRHEA